MSTLDRRPDVEGPAPADGCPRCAQPAGGGRFCTHCGEPLAAAAAPPAGPVPPAAGAAHVEALPDGTSHGGAEDTPIDHGQDATTVGGSAPPTRALPTHPLPPPADPTPAFPTEMLPPYDQPPYDQPPYDQPPYGGATETTSLRPGTAAPQHAVVWDDGSADVPAEVAPVRRRRSLALALSLAVLLVAGLAGGGLLYVRHEQGAPVREALDGSTPEFNRIVDGLVAADGLPEVVEVAGRAPEAAEVVGALEERAARADGPRAEAVAAQLRAEGDVLEAVGTLAGLEDEPLDVWSRGHAQLRTALEAEDGAREDLRAQDADRAAALSDTAPMMSALTQTVGGVLATDVTAQAESLLEALQAARTTGEVREAVTDVAVRRDAVAAAADALDDAGGKQVLTAYAEVLDTAAPLASLSGDSLATWATARVPFGQSLSSLARAAGSDGGDVRSGITPAVAAVDGLVTRAQDALEAWEERRDAAEAARKAAVAAVGSYTTAFRASVTTYDALRVALGDFTDQVDQGAIDVFEADTFLTEAYEQRLAVRDALLAEAPPEALRAQHDRVVAVVRRGANGVGNASSGLRELESCFEACDVRTTAGWLAFQSESDEISKEYAAAVAAWNEGARKAAADAAATPLPARPEV